MSKFQTTTERTMLEYFDSLLSEEPAAHSDTEIAAPEPVVLAAAAELPEVEPAPASPVPVADAEVALDAQRRQNLAALFKSVSPVSNTELVTPPAEQKEELQTLEMQLAESGLETMSDAIIPPNVVEEMAKQGEFQTLFFEVAGLTLAVPLKKLGGIHRIGRTNHIIGRPDWFMGVMPTRGEQYNVVNTAMWVMPEKCTPELEQRLDYQYLIMLDDSPWGLACEKVLTAERLTVDEVKWREQLGRRPWLAGMVIDKMCALLNVDAMIALLSQGLES